MNNSRTIVTAMVAVLLFVPVMVSNPIDAETGDTESFTTYSEQLTSNQLLIYQALEGLKPSDDVSASSYKVSVDGYRLSVYVSGEEVDRYRSTHADKIAGMDDDQVYALTAAEKMLETVYPDTVKAVQATKMDDAMAFWAWSADQVSYLLNGQGHCFRESDVGFEEQIEGQIVRIADGYYGIDGLEFNIYISEKYLADGGSMKSKVDKTREAIESVKIDGDSPRDIVKGINSYLTGSEFGYDTDDKNPFHGTVYGAFVSEVEGKHLIVCMAYASAFKALCDRYEVPCKVVVGLAETQETSDLHAWDHVIIEGNVYAVDSTWNASHEDTYLAVGEHTVGLSGNTFSQEHQPFSTYASYFKDDTASIYNFVVVEHLSPEAYEWPQPDKSIFDYLMAYSQWIIVGIICILLAYTLINMGRKGE
ncbi:MAG: hypothetical protein MJZ68_07675 [archaeon]|nr:hypothetical protein [archaeon]